MCCCYISTQQSGFNIAASVLCIWLLFLLSVQQWKRWCYDSFTTTKESELWETENQLIVVSVRITCAEKSMSLGSCSLHPASLFKKSRRLPKGKTDRKECQCLLCVCTNLLSSSANSPLWNKSKDQGVVTWMLCVTTLSCWHLHFLLLDACPEYLTLHSLEVACEYQLLRVLKMELFFFLIYHWP